MNIGSVVHGQNLRAWEGELGTETGMRPYRNWNVLTKEVPSAFLVEEGWCPTVFLSTALFGCQEGEERLDWVRRLGQVFMQE